MSIVELFHMTSAKSCGGKTNELPRKETPCNVLNDAINLPTVGLRYALRRLSSFVSLEYTKSVRCAVLLIRYAVPAQPHNQHVMVL